MNGVEGRQGCRVRAAAAEGSKAEDGEVGNLRKKEIMYAKLSINFYNLLHFSVSSRIRKTQSWRDDIHRIFCRFTAFPGRCRLRFTVAISLNFVAILLRLHRTVCALKRSVGKTAAGATAAAAAAAAAAAEAEAEAAAVAVLVSAA
jgi:hypothetical protein